MPNQKWGRGKRGRGTLHLMHPNHESPQRGWLSVEEIRLVSDLRIMHAKVDELCQLVRSLKKRHDEVAIHKYADHELLGENIEKIDEIYLWFVKLNEVRRAANSRG
jgi:hypothetical protein